MIDIFRCFFCNKSLAGDRSAKVDDEYFFWCDKKCHDDYHKKVEEDGRVLRQWSAYMCGEGPCPKEMRHLIVEHKHDVDDLPKKGKKSKAPTAKATSKDSIKPGRKCGKCGDVGHNARTCGKSEVPSPQKNKSRTSKRRRYICGKCGKPGHNARTCKK